MSAAVRLIPRPPALVLSRKTNMSALKDKTDSQLPFHEKTTRYYDRFVCKLIRGAGARL